MSKLAMLLAAVGLFSAWAQAEIPVCPADGTNLTADYPVTGIFVSESSVGISGLSLKQFVLEALTIKGQSTPDLFLFSEVNPEEGRSLETEGWKDIRSAVEKLSDNSYAKHLFNIKAGGTPWMQDYLWSQVDPVLGLNQIRYLAPYRSRSFSSRDKFENFAKLVASDPSVGKDFQVGPDLDVGKEISGSFYGGNLMSLPGGDCVVGSAHFANAEDRMTFARTRCGAKAQIFTLPTSWLAVGHVDEVLSIVPANSKYFFVYASPLKGYELGSFTPQDIRAVEKLDVQIRSSLERLRSLVLKAHPEIKIELVPYPVQFGDLDGDAFSIVPNSVNQVIVADKIFVPDPKLDTWRSYLREVAQQLGKKIFFLDTGSANTNLGNAHCLIRVTYICR